jgi:hypothetical protein
VAEHPAKRETRRDQARREALEKIAELQESGELVIRQASEAEIERIFGKPKANGGCGDDH